MVRVGGYHLVYEIKDFQGVAEAIIGNIIIGADFDAQEVGTRRPDGPKGCAEVAFSEAGNIDVTWGVSRKVGKDGNRITVWK